MDKILKLKFIAITIYAIVAMFFFYDDNFIENSSFIINPHQYGHASFMVATFSLGIIFSAMIYNLAFYFYIRNRQYLYYALAQFFVLLVLINVESLLIHPFTEMYAFHSPYLLDISQTLMLIFSLLFIKEFFQSPKLNYSLKIVIYLSLADLALSVLLGHTVLTKFVPTVIWVWFILSEVYRDITKKDVPFYFLMVGWHIVIVVLVLELTYVINPNTLDFPFLHVAFALESMLLSFALSYRFKLIDDEQKIQQSLLLQQSRLASMGEMISIIAHQWRQPLNFLSYSFMHIKRNCNNDEEAIQTIKEANEQLQYMSQTIENFRNFYNPSKEKDSFSMENSCQNILKIISPTLNLLHIKIDLEVKEDFSYFANSNEFEQVILNLANNAKDALVERNIANPSIKIIIENNQILVIDNAGGINPANKEKIFEPYFSTKKESDGIGLYIAKTIIEQEMKGKLSLESNNHGCKFIIDFSQ